MESPLSVIDGASWGDALVPAALVAVLGHPRVHRGPAAPAPFDAEDRVMVVGTGPAAVEALLRLRSRGHTGRTVAVSPRAVWPPGAALAPLREELVLVDRAAEILDVRAFSSGLVVWLRLTGADVPARDGAVEVWNVEHIVICDDPAAARAT